MNMRQHLNSRVNICILAIHTIKRKKAHQTPTVLVSRGEGYCFFEFICNTQIQTLLQLDKCRETPFAQNILHGPVPIPGFTFVLLSLQKRTWVFVQCH